MRQSKYSSNIHHESRSGNEDNNYVHDRIKFECISVSIREKSNSIIENIAVYIYYSETTNEVHAHG